MSADPIDHSAESVPVHDHAEEVAHAWHHFRDNAKFFASFLSIIFLTVFAFYVNFGSPWNMVVAMVLAAARSGLIAYFMSSLFTNFSLVFRTFIFTLIFFIGMVFLSLWDSPLNGIGNPIKDNTSVSSMHQ